MPGGIRRPSSGPRALADRLLRCALRVSFLLCAVLSPAAKAPQLSTEKPPVRLPLIEGKDIRFTRYSTEQGLSENRVDHMLQDAQGFLWMGTYDGLDRFDGNRFLVYKPKPHDLDSLGGAVIYSLFQDRSGVLWIGVDKGLDRFDPVKQRFTHFYSNPNGSASPSGHVEWITQDRNGMLWLATRGGLDRLDPVSLQFTHFRADPNDPHTLASNDTRYVFEDREGTLWVATSAGADALDLQTGKVVRHYPSSWQPPLDRIYEDRSGTLWLCATRRGGVLSLDRKTGVFTPYKWFDEWPEPPGTRGCSSILEDRHGMLWLGTRPDGVVKFDRNLRQFTRYKNQPGISTSLGSNEGISLIEDREGSIWVGTATGGVDRFSSEPSPFTIYRSEPGNPNSLDRDSVYSVFKDSQGTLWIATDQLIQLDRKTGRYSFYRHDPANPGSISSNEISAILEDSAGLLWVGTWGGGLNRLDRRTGRFQAYRHDPANPASLSNDFIRSLLLDHDGNVWAGTEDGINRLDTRTGRFTVFRYPGPIDNRMYVSLAKDSDGTIWAGAPEEGLQHLDPKTGKFVAYQYNPKVRGSLSNNRVNDIYVDHSGTLWVATQNGLDRFDRKAEEFTVFGEHEGLPADAVLGIQEDRAGRLWVATTYGLSRFDPRSVAVKNYYVGDGLAGNEFERTRSHFKSADGEMLFAGFNGITAFYPDRIVDNPYIPPVVLTDFRLFNTSLRPGKDSVLENSISFTKSLTLSHEQSIFSFEFSSLSYLAPARNRYRYMLEGLEKAWNEVGADQRLVTYTTLPSGRYTFRVQGSSANGVWNESGVSVAITVLPPWWKTWWFLSTAAAILLLSGWAIYYVRVRAIRSRNRELTLLNNELSRLNRELRAVSDCNAVLVRATDEQQLLSEICRIVCEKAGYRMAWVGYAENDAVKSVRQVASAGVDEGYLAAARVVWADTEYGRGPIGKSIRSGTSVVADDFATDPHLAPWRERALERGLHSCIALPLKDERGAVFGSFTIYSPEAGAFTAEETRLLEELAEDMAFGITVLRSRAERTRAENEVFRLNAELEERVRRRTAQLEAANKELEAFSYTVSHDLRGPLRTIDAFSLMLLETYEGKIDEEGKDWLRRVRSGVARMGQLINDILTLSRVSRAEMKTEAVNLSTLAQEVATELCQREPERKISFMAESELVVQGDPGLLRSLLENLIGNAWKFTVRCSEPRIEFGALEKENGRVYFLRDNGVGFDMKFADKLFGAFQRLHSGTEFPGTGIGLATAQRIVQRHGGRIWAESRVGEGATFFFTFA